MTILAWRALPVSSAWADLCQSATNRAARERDLLFPELPDPLAAGRPLSVLGGARPSWADVTPEAKTIVLLADRAHLHADSEMILLYDHLRDEEEVQRRMNQLDFLGGVGGRSDGDNNEKRRRK